MSPSTLSFPTILFTSSILVLLSTSIFPVQCTNPDVAASGPLMIQTACSDASININTDLCLHVLQTIPKIASATDLHSLAVAIIESGISNSTNTRNYIEAILGKYQTADARSDAKVAFEMCKESYGEIASRFSKALQGFKDSDDYMTTTYTLQSASTDCVRTCATVMAEENVGDMVVLRGNNVVPVFGMSAISIIRRLHNRSAPATKP